MNIWHWSRFLIADTCVSVLFSHSTTRLQCFRPSAFGCAINNLFFYQHWYRTFAGLRFWATAPKVTFAFTYVVYFIFLQLLHFNPPPPSLYAQIPATRQKSQPRVSNSSLIPDTGINCYPSRMRVGRGSDEKRLVKHLVRGSNAKSKVWWIDRWTDRPTKQVKFTCV